MRQASLPPNLGRLLQSELKTGETILWTGQPAPSRMARLVRAEYLKGIATTLGGTLWSGAMVFACFLPQSGTGPHKPYNPESAFLNILIGVSFIAAGPLGIAGGLVMLLAPKKQRESAANTVYVVTDRRALILQGHGRSGKVTAQSLPQYALGHRTIMEEEDGSGDLLFPDAGTFTLESSFSQFFQNAEKDIGTVTTIPIGFYGILDVKSVDELIQHTLAGKKGIPSA